MGKFTIKISSSEYKYSLCTDNGQIIIASPQVYKRMQSCKEGIKSVKRNAPDAVIEDQTVEAYDAPRNPKYKIYIDGNGEYRFQLIAKNGHIIAVSGSYETKESCLKRIQWVRENAQDADVLRKL